MKIPALIGQEPRIKKQSWLPGPAGENPQWSGPLGWGLVERAIAAQGGAGSLASHISPERRSATLSPAGLPL